MFPTPSQPNKQISVNEIGLKIPINLLKVKSWRSRRDEDVHLEEDQNRDEDPDESQPSQQLVQCNFFLIDAFIFLSKIIYLILAFSSDVHFKLWFLSLDCLEQRKFKSTNVSLNFMQNFVVLSFLQTFSKVLARTSWELSLGELPHFAARWSQYSKLLNKFLSRDSGRNDLINCLRALESKTKHKCKFFWIYLLYPEVLEFYNQQ